jgi:hypothetical protein
MDIDLHVTLAIVTYRATLTDGREADLRLAMPSEAATVVDAWRRLSAVYGAVDPTSLEIEVRQGPFAASAHA